LMMGRSQGRDFDDASAPPYPAERRRTPCVSCFRLWPKRSKRSGRASGEADVGSSVSPPSAAAAAPRSPRAIRDDRDLPKPTRGRSGRGVPACTDRRRPRRRNEWAPSRTEFWQTSPTKSSDESGFVRSAVRSGCYRVLATAHQIRVRDAVADASIVVQQRSYASNRREHDRPASLRCVGFSHSPATRRLEISRASSRKLASFVTMFGPGDF